MSWWRTSDRPRHMVLGFLFGVIVAVLAGLIITFLFRSPARVVDEWELAGRQAGAAVGRVQGRELGAEAGERSALQHLPSLLAEGTEADGYQLAYRHAWNEAVHTAIDQAAHDPVLQLRRMRHWEALLLATAER